MVDFPTQLRPVFGTENSQPISLDTTNDLFACYLSRQWSNAVMDPKAITVVVVGQDEYDNYVPNVRNQVYEHMMPCPLYCPGASNAYIQ